MIRRARRSGLRHMPQLQLLGGGEEGRKRDMRRRGQWEKGNDKNVKVCFEPGVEPRTFKKSKINPDGPANNIQSYRGPNGNYGRTRVNSLKASFELREFV